MCNIICVDKPAPIRIIISRLQVIISSFIIMIVSTISKTVKITYCGRKCTRDIGDVTPSIISILRYERSSTVKNAGYVTLYISCIDIYLFLSIFKGFILINKTYRITNFVVPILYRIAIGILCKNSTIIGNIVGCRTVNGFRCSNAVIIISIAISIYVICYFG